MKSYLAKTTIDLLDYEFYIRPGDLLVHDAGNHNRLTVFRNGQLVKVAKQEPIGILAFLKNRFIEEVVAKPAPPVVVVVPAVPTVPAPEVVVVETVVVTTDTPKAESRKRKKDTEPEEPLVEIEVV